MTNVYTPSELANLCNDLLSVDDFEDYCPNGLQVDANYPIKKIITGVTACQALIDEAVKQKANAIIVHHGYFWKGEALPLTGMKGRRIRTLLQNNLSLLAYHLPLDAHSTLGNNAQLADTLGATITGALHPNEKHPVGNIASLPPISPDTLFDKLSNTLGRTPLHINAGNAPITKLGICTGAAQDMIEQAYKMGCHAFVSGEISERTTHIAREMGIHYYAAGHHATERGGIRALGDYLARTKGLEVVFIDIKNPV